VPYILQRQRRREAEEARQTTAFKEAALRREAWRLEREAWRLGHEALFEAWRLRREAMSEAYRLKREATL